MVVKFYKTDILEKNSPVCTKCENIISVNLSHAMDAFMDYGEYNLACQECGLVHRIDIKKQKVEVHSLDVVSVYRCRCNLILSITQENIDEISKGEETATFCPRCAYHTFILVDNNGVLLEHLPPRGTSQRGMNPYSI